MVDGRVIMRLLGQQYALPVIFLLTAGCSARDFLIFGGECLGIRKLERHMLLNIGEDVVLMLILTDFLAEQPLFI